MTPLDPFHASREKVRRRLPGALKRSRPEMHYPSSLEKPPTDGRFASPPPEQTGFAPKARPICQFHGGISTRMNVVHIEGRSENAFSFCPKAPQNTKRQSADPTSPLPSVLFRMMPWFFSISLGISSLLALWTTHGLMALFLSGQFLSAGSWVFRVIAGKTIQPCFAQATASRGHRR